MGRLNRLVRQFSHACTVQHFKRREALMEFTHVMDSPLCEASGAAVRGSRPPRRGAGARLVPRAPGARRPVSRERSRLSRVSTVLVRSSDPCVHARGVCTRVSENTELSGSLAVLYRTTYARGCGHDREPDSHDLNACAFDFKHRWRSLAHGKCLCAGAAGNVLQASPRNTAARSEHSRRALKVTRVERVSFSA